MPAVVCVCVCVLSMQLCMLMCARRRCVACFPDQKGYLVGSIEGRVAVQHVDDAQVCIDGGACVCLSVCEGVVLGESTIVTPLPS